jgi:hypothetical protein
MIIRLSFKTPDILDAVNEHVVMHCEVHDDHDRACWDCRETKMNAKHEAQNIKDRLGKFIQYDEYVTIEFDTEKGTATVVPL